ncbi:MAG: hypothetical protein IPN89_03845 [Saprospiraceae bacterium]|nr:hypothetical protein [Saprospiraceae bacterium]
MLPLVDADIREVYDHYILQSEDMGRKYQLYDGIKQQEIEIATDEKLKISGNQKYMLKYKLKENKLAKQYFFDVEIRNTSNEILSKGIIPTVGEDNYESHDVLYPFNNGKGFVISSNESMLTVYSVDKNQFSISGTILNKALLDFRMSDDASDIICLFYNEDASENMLRKYKFNDGKYILCGKRFKEESIFP